MTMTAPNNTAMKNAPNARKNPLPGMRKQRRGLRAVTKRVGERGRNDFYNIAAEFKRRHPMATAIEAWRHFAAVAMIGSHDVMLAYDVDTDTLVCRPNTERIGTRKIKWRCFQQQYYRLIVRA